ncbi:MAG TPA: hypothetical protein VGX69_05975 [Solirubrobacteraceae bacterium]|jgi:DNA-binding transcriptional MerR regulator|nr:hypothetical protein [Solirubrobacteraceae bacterium]
MTDDWIDGVGLIARAAEHGHQVTPRSLELWRYRGLLPRPHRRPGGRAVWLYPPGTARQLIRLLHWRQRATKLDEIRVALWVEGFSVELDGVRKALAAVVDDIAGAVRRDLGSAADLSSTIDLLAHRLADMRSRAPIPRVVRMRREQRARGYGYMLALASGDAKEIETRAADAVFLERMFGLRSGHGPGLTELSPLNDEIVRLIPRLSVERVQTVLISAPDRDYEFVRLLARPLLLWLPVLLTVMRSTLGARGVALADAAQEMLGDPPAAVHGAIVIGMLVSLHAKAPDQERLDELVRELSAGAIDAEMLKLVPTSLRRDVFRGLAPEQRHHLLERVADADTTPPSTVRA